MLYQPLELVVLRAGGFFDFGEGTIEIIIQNEGLMASIKANEGYSLHSVTKGEEDVTASFADGMQVPRAKGYSIRQLYISHIVSDKVADFCSYIIVFGINVNQ
ncbi:MAG: hypothetical protein K2J06_00210 [Muribaculaceae bacterium]|nr:hypothetical protein [Muribaculaceae bacterium]